MQSAFHAALGLAALVGLTAAATPTSATATLAGPKHGLATRLDGKWSGKLTSSMSFQPEYFTMIWNSEPGGRVIGTIMPSGRPHYAVNVVWSSDTAFIYESAPHYNRMLHEEVVSRGVVHFKGNGLQGNFEARPTKYEGRTVKGTFNAARKS